MPGNCTWREKFALDKIEYTEDIDRLLKSLEEETID